MKTLPPHPRKHNEAVLSNAEPGDMIEFPRGAYSHWAVYIGKEEVVHFGIDMSAGGKRRCNCTHLSSVSGKLYNKAIVQKQNFWEVVENSKAIINHTKDTKYRPFPKKRIVENAMSYIDQRGYNVLFNNCEHFASLCRYGKKLSKQQKKALVVSMIPLIGWHIGIGYMLVSVIQKIRRRRRRSQPEQEN